MSGVGLKAKRSKGGGAPPLASALEGPRRTPPNGGDPRNAPGKKVVAIGNLIKTTENWNPVRSKIERFLYVDLSAVDQESKTITGAKEINCKSAPSRARQIIATGDVLVSTVRPNLNGVALVPPYLDGATASTGFCVLRSNPNLLDNRYLFNWIKSPFFVDDMVRKSTGASYPAVSDRIILDSSIPLPSLPEQRRIAEVLDRVEGLRANRRRSIKLLTTLAESIFERLIGTASSNINGYPKSSLGELLKFKSGNFLPASEMPPNGLYPVFGGNGISGYHDDFLFPDPMIVVGRVGAYCGCVHKTPPNSWITDNALYVFDKSDTLDFNYLFHALQHAKLNQYSSQSGQPLISGSRIYPVEILVPPMVIQKEYSKQIGEIENITATHQASLTQLDALFASLQHRAFRGEL